MYVPCASHACRGCFTTNDREGNCGWEKNRTIKTLTQYLACTEEVEINFGDGSGLVPEPRSPERGGFLL